jgi:hypothetical protein
MKIDWTARPNGIDMLELRDFLKSEITADDFAYTGLGYIIQRERLRQIRKYKPRVELFPALEERAEEKCKLYLKTLLEHGYIELRPELPGDSYYKQTLAGSAFAMASRRRFSRKSAQKQLDEFLRRCRDLNTLPTDINVPESLCQVDSVILFGSFSNEDSDDVGDVDLCLTLSIKDQQLVHLYRTETFKQYFLNDAIRRDPEIMARKFLKKGLNILSIGSNLPDGVTGRTLFSLNGEISGGT